MNVSRYLYFLSTVLFPALMLLVAVPCARGEGELGFLERFALSADRAHVLGELIPGTEEFYFYSTLHAQQTGEREKVRRLLKSWRERHGETIKLREMEHREALLNYAVDPGGTLAYLQKHLGLHFNHQQEKLDAKADFPSSLGAEEVSRAAFLKDAFRRKDLSGVSEAGLDFLLRDQVELSPAQRRELLGRLRYPDYDQLVRLIAADLGSQESGGFGEFEIHRRLTLIQLDELVALRPELADNPRLVEERIQRLQPSGDESLVRNPAARRAYLDRLWEYVKTLSPAFGAMKASVLSQRLHEARGRGEYPREEFMAYLELPRAMPYMNPEYLRAQQSRGLVVDFTTDFSSSTGFPPIGPDEGLVREYLEHFFVADENYQRYAAFVREPYLKKVFAETKLLHGLGEPEEWLSMLTPGEIQQLKDRVEITFSPGNREHFRVADDVSLTVAVKNVPELIVKVYEINALNFYLDRAEEINTDLDLDGLIANEEAVYKYVETPLRRHSETFDFKSLKGKQGIWVIEFIGNGISSRALVRKGKLQLLSRPTVGGEIVVVLDDENRPVKSPAAWFGGQRYAADEKGFILLPFSTAGTVPLILTEGGFASFTRITLPQEDYQFDAGVLLEQETLLPGAEATVAVRPVLSLKAEPIALATLTETTLRVTTTDLDGISSLSETESFPLFDDRESTYRFRVPNRLKSVRVELSGLIPSLVRPGETTKVSAEKNFELNGVETQALVADSYLSKVGENYVVQLLGKTGEAVSDRPVPLSFTHRDFTSPLLVTLKTDAAGRIELGKLPGVISVTCAPAQLPSRTWTLPRARSSRTDTLHAKTGETIEIPLVIGGPGFGRADFAVFETRSAKLVADVFSQATYEKGIVSLTGLTPGDYELFLKAENRALALKVTAATTEHFNYALSSDRSLEIRNPKPLQIAGLERKGDKIELSIVNADAFTRVHLVATRFLPEFDPFGSLDFGHHPPLFEVRRGTNATRSISGRDIGEEYRYILERRNYPKFPGNSLSRPGLLLNPWEINETATIVDEASRAEALRRSEGMAAEERAAGAPVPQIGAKAKSAPQDETPSLNFLARQAIVLTNLELGEGGTLSLDLAQLGDRQHLHVVAVNTFNTVYRELALPEPDGGVAKRNLRLQTSFDPKEDFTQRRNVTLLKAGQVLTVGDFRASEVQTYDTVAGLYRTLLGINPEVSFATFGFLAHWADLKEEKKRALYSEFACHELNFFLSQKDPTFFAAVVGPYLKHKKDKTFLDEYLIAADLARYLQPWEFSRLNIVERILLARRIGEEERVRTAGHVDSLRRLTAPDPAQDAFFFRRALRGRHSDLSSSSELAGVNGAEGGDAFADPVAAGGGLRVRRTVSRRMPAAESAPMAAEAQKPSASFSLRPAEGISDKDLTLKAKAQALYQVLDATRELAENNYYEIPLTEQNADLVTVNGFWKNYADWDGKGGFYSREFPAATKNFTEMMFALSVLDLPFVSEEHQVTVKDNVLTLTAASPLVVFHEEILESTRAAEATPILVSQNFLRVDDRFREVDGETIDKFVTDEFLTAVVYASQVVVTNPTSSAHRLDLLVQIPEGAVPVAGSDYTRSYPVHLESFSTKRQEVQFYFPSSSGEGTFAVYPVRVSKNEKVIAAGAVTSFKVVDQLTRFDEASWEYLSQYGSSDEVLAYLGTHNLHRIDLSRIAWRVREDLDFFKKATDLIASRHAYDDTLWSYGIHHHVPGAIREYLKHREDFLQQCGRWRDCALVSLDPVERQGYQHLEYAPFVNARAHRLGRENKILNDRFRAQYGAFIEVAAYKPALDPGDQLAVSAYLSLQDRLPESHAWFDAIDPATLVSRLQYDYLKSYHALSRGDVETAKAVAIAHENYPVVRWQEKFAAVAAQVREIEGAVARPARETREGQIEHLSAKDPFLELTVKGREAHLRYRNLESVTVNYYEMDLEFLFSSKPFVSGGSGQFSFIKPNFSEQKNLPADAETLRLAMPEAFASRNVLVEVVAAGRAESVAIYSNTLNVQISAGYGQIEVLGSQDQKPLPRSYVKVYARMKDGQVRFFKDGYTDLRGKFDYVSLSTNELDEVEALSLLVMSESNGSLVREVAPPQR